jgi:hypothetical protein
MNKLDGKVIVDREDLHTAVCYVRQAAFQHEQKGYGTHHALLDLIARLEEQALATDLTGWAAVPVLSTIQMDVAGSDEMLGDEFAGLDSDVAAKVWNAMLEASPPLPRGGE